MVRAFFLAVGITMCIVGAECLVVEKAELTSGSVATATRSLFDAVPGNAAIREIKPPDWAPWSLLSGGTIILIYSYTLPKRVST